MVFIHIARTINFYWYTIGRITEDGVILYEHDRLHAVREAKEIHEIRKQQNVIQLKLHEGVGRVVESVSIDGNRYDILNPKNVFAYHR